MSAPDDVSLEYDNTDADARAWNRYRLAHTPQGRHQFAFTSCLIGFVESLALFALFTLFWPETGAPGRLGLALALGVAIGVLFYLFGRRTASDKGTRRLLKRNHFRAFLGPTRVTPGPEGLRIAWAEGEAVRHWSALSRVVPAPPGHLALHWSEDEFSLIPERAFGGDAERRARFLALLDHYRTGGEIAGGAAALMAFAAPDAVAPAQEAPGGGAPWWTNREAVDADRVEAEALRQRAGGDRNGTP